MSAEDGDSIWIGKYCMRSQEIKCIKNCLRSQEVNNVLNLHEVTRDKQNGFFLVPVTSDDLC